jgi:hypothetical protein
MTDLYMLSKVTAIFAMMRNIYINKKTLTKFRIFGVQAHQFQRSHFGCTGRKSHCCGRLFALTERGETGRTSAIDRTQ